jgi:uncharacterized protein Yka (UPF0111/DUF47 family)
MQSSGQNLREFCKKIEDDINRKLLSEANSLAFITMVGEALENHLDQLVALRESSKQRLDWMDLPTRDDIADIANKIIDYEDRLDRLDENLYQALEGMKECRRKMAGLVWKMAEMSTKVGHGKGIKALEENDQSIIF